MHACNHAFTNSRLDPRGYHPSDTLTTPLLTQRGKMALDLAENDEVKAAFAEHAEHAAITDDNKNALLRLCARFGLASRLRAVLQAGADVAHADKNGRTALVLAAEGGHADAVRVLLEHKADIEAKDEVRDEHGGDEIVLVRREGMAGRPSTCV